MNDEIDAGAAYLASLKQSTSSTTSGAAPARGRDALAGGGLRPQAGPNSSSFDRRKSPRYKCEGSARIQEIGKSVSTWAKFSDISLHGCYVETASPLPVRASLSLRLEARGFRIEANGDVRVSYPGLGMGVSFYRITEEDRERLRQLIGLLAPPSVILGPRPAGSSATASAIRTEKLSAIANPEAALQSLVKFFEERHVMSKDEFLRIVRLSQ
jgi:hypothetical protein